MSPSTRIRIDCNYPDARRAEAFLNSWEETFLPDGVDNQQYVISREKNSGELLSLRHYKNSYEFL